MGAQESYKISGNITFFMFQGSYPVDDEDSRSESESGSGFMNSPNSTFDGRKKGESDTNVMNLNNFLL